MKKDVITNSNNFDLRLSDLAQAGQKNRQVTRWLVISLVLDIVLTVVLGAVTLRTIHNSQALSDQNQLSINRTCKAINITNAGQLKLWGYIFAIPPTSAATLTDEQLAAQAKQLADFKTYIAKTFAPREC